MRSIALLPFLAHLARAQVTDAITDLSIYKLLAPCASYAVSSQVRAFDDSTQLGCGTSASQLQSCICSQSDVSSSVASNISSVVESRCGSSASSDQWSASEVLRQYCNPKETITFETPTTNIVTDYMTDVDKMDYLAPCAYSALSLAAMYSPSAHCPDSASTLYNSCICNKGDVVQMIQSVMSSRVANSCENREDVKLAAEFYQEYCAMNNGTSSFAQIPTPPGDMTYYITGLSGFSSLKECGRSALSSVILGQTTRLCPSGPQALASCVCLKEGMVHDVYGSMTAKVKVGCGYDDEDSVNSAIDVFNYYCSAADAKVTAKVSDTARQKYPTAVEAADSTSGGAKETGGGGGGSNQDGDDEGNGSPNAGVIAGAVVGSIVGVALVAGGIFWFIRHRKRHAAADAAASRSNGDVNAGAGELEDRSNLVSPKYEMHTPSPQVASSELSGVPRSTPPPGFGPAELPNDQRFQQSTTRYELGG